VRSVVWEREGRGLMVDRQLRLEHCLIGTFWRSGHGEGG
jgi:hypothetical protein